MSSGFLVFALALGCTNKDGGGDGVERIDGVTVEANENNAMSAWVVLTPDVDLEGVTVVYGAQDDFDFRTPERTIAAGTETRILVLGLEHDTDNQLRLEATKPDGTAVARMLLKTGCESSAPTTDPLMVALPGGVSTHSSCARDGAAVATNTRQTRAIT